jgi:hypothetical protein
MIGLIPNPVDRNRGGAVCSDRSAARLSYRPVYFIPPGGWLRIPIYPARDSDLNPATHSDPFPAICSDAMSASGVVASQQVDDGHLTVTGFRSRL